MDVIPITERKAIFARLREKASRLDMSEEERVIYNDELKKYRDFFNQIDFAKESGFREGFEKGYKEGYEKGREEGRMEAILLIASNLKNTGMSVEQIANVTGLSREEVMKL